VSSDSSQRQRKVRVLVADTSPFHSRLLADSLRHDSLFEVFAFEAEPSDLVRAVQSQTIDVLVVNSNLEDQPLRGLEIVQDLRTEYPGTQSVVLLSSSKDDFILRAFRAGARGVFTKNDALELLNECVRMVCEGKVWANGHAMRVVVDALASSPGIRTSNSQSMNLLSKRELEVVWALAEGLTNREIAEQLKLSPHTIKNYLFRIFDKLGVSSRIELLFMVLSQPDLGMAQKQGSVESKNGVSDYSRTETALLEKSAEAGLPAAQLALAQLHLARGRDPKDLVEAYTWYLVATERALVARGHMTKMLTAEQIAEAKQRASIRLSKLKHISPDAVPFSS
jgi:two-component system, NarL family, nitrate/nitrite response regulator NarL